MTEFIPRIVHSLMLRLVFMLLALGGLIVAVLLVSWLVFQTIDAQMASMKAERLPEIRGSADVVAETGATRRLLTSILVAEDSRELQNRGTAARQVFSDFQTALEQLPAEKSSVMIPMLKVAEDAVSVLIQERARAFTEFAAMEQAIRDASRDASTASTLIEEANDSAFFDMTLSGEETITAIDDTLTRLLEEDFEQFQNALGMRAETNLIAGLAIAYDRNGRSQIGSILVDLANSGMDRLRVLMEKNEDVPAFETVLPALREAMTTFTDVFDGGGSVADSSDILAARLAVDTALSPALDDIYFSFVIANDDAKETNRASLEHLLEREVERMRVNAALDAATKHFFALLLQVSASRSVAELAFSQQELNAQAEDVVRLKAGTAFETQENLANLLRLADPESGLAAQRAVTFDAQAAASAAAQEAAKAVDTIALETLNFSDTALTKIEDAAEFLGGAIEKARANLVNIAYVSFAVMLAVPVLLWYLVTRPFGRVTAVTERLAGGDLSEIHELSHNQGELGRMASALHVFRENALRNIAMQEEERKRERELLEAEKLAEESRRNEELRRAAEEARFQEEARAQEAKLAAEAEKRQRKEMAESKERMEEQSHIVSNLAQGLKHLAAGDLTGEIEEPFPEAYEALRLDFNAAVANLSRIVEQLKQSSETIEESCGEISAASDDLARRTESNASTLAETVSSVGSLSSSVAGAAKNAGDAAVKIQGVREKTKLNSDVMIKAKSAMGRVDEASGKITSIVGIIDAIAFQTNLLALNAGVEAARAGSAGQGFAVVANEVRILAQRCSEAAGEIGSVVEESTTTVQEGVELTVKANEAMAAINDGIEQIAGIVDGIASSARSQASGLEDVDEAIRNLDKSTQQNAAMFEETSASNQLLASEAQRLSGVVQSFTLREQSGVPQPGAAARLSA